jgi:hypothetical protein
MLGRKHALFERGGRVARFDRDFGLPEHLAGDAVDWDHVADRIAASWELAAPRRSLEAGGR